jgi:4-carboxymuconolactone decarboxylase
MRLPLIPPNDLNAEQRPLYDDMKAGIEGHFAGFKAIADDGTLLGPWNPMLHYQPMGQAMWEMIKSISFSATLPKPVREVAILVTGAKFDAAYELYAHVRVADRIGLSDSKIATISAGNRPNDLTAEEVSPTTQQRR